jgi:hypothetical protein
MQFILLMIILPVRFMKLAIGVSLASSEEN